MLMKWKVAEAGAAAAAETIVASRANEKRWRIGIPPGGLLMR
jgi:hypothetical protein